jgi:nicotinate phosphoribosyltransferase
MIIESMLDNDLYKMSMMQFVVELFPDAQVEYRFKNRGKQRFNVELLKRLKQEIMMMGQLSLTDNEYNWIKSISFFKPSYAEYLKNFRYNPNDVECHLEDNDLVVKINGLWRDTILWEVPLMAIISELYFQIIDTNWNYDGQAARAFEKGTILAAHNCNYAGFATRRRRSFKSQETALLGLNSTGPYCPKSTLVGTSNMYLAMKYGLTPIGTMAHELFMAMSALEGLRHANYHTLQNWVRVYNTDLGIALTDTFGSDAFFDNFNKRLSKLYDGVRHDSGCPIAFADKTIAHYKKMGIDPMSKIIVFSDGLDVDKAIAIAKYCEGKIKYSFGIGTHFSNDFADSPSLNMVIKLWSVNGIPVVKLSDVLGKVMGDSDAVAVAQWTFQNKPLWESFPPATG